MVYLITNAIFYKNWELYLKFFSFFTFQIVVFFIFIGPNMSVVKHIATIVWKRYGGAQLQRKKYLFSHKSATSAKLFVLSKQHLLLEYQIGCQAKKSRLTCTVEVYLLGKNVGFQTKICKIQTEKITLGQKYCLNANYCAKMLSTQNYFILDKCCLQQKELKINKS